MIEGRDPVKTGGRKHSRHSSGPGNAHMKGLLPYLAGGNWGLGGVRDSVGGS